MSRIKIDQIEVKELKADITNVGMDRKEEQQEQWEFFKKISGIMTDYLNKMINIPSTLFTPNFVLPSKAQFAAILKTIGLVKGVIYKFKQIDNALHSRDQRSTERERIARLSIVKGLEKNRWKVIKGDK